MPQHVPKLTGVGRPIPRSVANSGNGIPGPRCTPSATPFRKGIDGAPEVKIEPNEKQCFDMGLVWNGLAPRKWCGRREPELWRESAAVASSAFPETTAATICNLERTPGTLIAIVCQGGIRTEIISPLSLPEALLASGRVFPYSGCRGDKCDARQRQKPRTPDYSSSRQHRRISANRHPCSFAPPTG
jgi:hypothetical protein